jgi:LAO/AO transport system kinase
VTTQVLVTVQGGIGIHPHEGEILDSRIDAAKAGDRRALARLLTSIENGELRIQEPQRNNSEWKILALTGPPGVGKSCLLDRMLHEWIDHGLRVAVLAVDPSSPRSGGALLGDRVRMRIVDDVQRKDSVYVRSVATRKTSGSVPLVVREMAFCLLEVGWDKVVIETVGAGQSEVRCAAVADRIVLVEGPARGDGVQAEKAGLLELADAVIVNKSDLDGAQRHADELRESLHLGHEDAPDVLLVSALHGTGIEEASSMLLALDQSTRAGRARWRERLLSHHERQLLEHSKFESLLTKIEEGLMSFDDAYDQLRNGNE